MADSTLIDPLARRIVLHNRTWYAHIIKGHPEVGVYRDLVEAAVRSPREIRFSTTDPDCRLYYGHGPRPTVIMVVGADVAAGFVKTAYLARKITGGNTEWSAPTH